MKSYSHILSKLFYEPLLVTPMRHAALLKTLELHMGVQRVDMPDAPAPSDDDEDEVKVEGSTVIIPVHGTLVKHNSDIGFSECGCSMEDLCAAIQTAENDSRVDTVIYDFRSPGGTVTGIPEAGRKILHSRKNTIAFTDSECCSGAIWLAAQCGRFFCTESSRVGSVGVYTMVLDMTKAMEKEGVAVEAIFAAKYKLLGASFRPLANDEREILQRGVDKIYDQFKSVMESHRVVEDKNFGNGLVFDGREAVEIGFCDGVVEDLGEVFDMIED